LGLLVGLSDYRWAETYRQYAAEGFPKDLPAHTRLFVCGDWGFDYYAEKAGALPMGKKTALLPTDFIIRDGITPCAPSEAFPRLKFVSMTPLGYPGPFAVLSKPLSAGFYSNGFGLFPYVPTREVKDGVILAQPLASAPPPQSPNPPAPH